jgi:Cu2+-exporting ATPase
VAQVLTEAAPHETAAAGSSQGNSACESTTLVVENMHCGGCMRKVEKALAEFPGVISARANLSARRVTVTSSKGRVTTDDLVDVLGKAGYKAAPLLEDAASDKSADKEFLRRVGVAGFAAMNIMLLSVAVWSGQAGDMEKSVQTLFHWISALIALPAVAYAGQPFFRSAMQALRSRRLNMDVPISLAVTLATAMSLFQTIRGSEHVYFDAAVSLLFFLLIGRFLDQSMRTRAAGAAANLLGLRGSTATVLFPDGSTERLSARALTPGMRILVATGERIGADGKIVEGRGAIDESLITGEAEPVTAEPGRQVFAGTLNMGAPLVIEATATNESTLLAEIGRLMTAAEQGRGRYVRLADRAASYYAPAVHSLGLMTFVGWLIMGHGWEPALTAAISVLIITCPCALALAVPAVQVAATSRLFGRGVIVKAADGLERLAETDTIVFDKTGTLTLGEPRLIEPQSCSDDLLIRAAALAAASRHPYARAVVREARERGLKPVAATEVREVTGAGLARQTEAGEERLGSAAWCGVGEQGDAATLWYKPADGDPVALRFEDQLRPDAAEVIAQLKRAGYAVELLSGDRPGAVEAAAREAGIDHWQARQNPAEKIARLEALKAAGRKVLMVGDGLNDAPALAAAHASMSPSTAADVSQTTADLVFQGERLGAVVEALGVAKSARRMALQNFGLSLGYNAIFVPLAVAGYATPLIAAIAMSSSSIAVTANAVRLRSKRVKV